MQEWRIERTAGHCVKTGRVIAAGESYYVVLFEEGEGFRRQDYSQEAWSDPPAGAFCCFKSRMPTKEKDKKKRLLVDDDVLVDFFIRLKDEKQRLRLQFRFVLALILMRKRLLKYEQTRTEGEDEIWRMTLSKNRGVHDVLNPRLTDDEIEQVSRELGSILHADAGQFVDDTDLHDSQPA